MTYAVAILFLVLAVSSSVLLLGFINTRRSSHRAKAAAAAATSAASTPARRPTARSLPKPPPLSEDSLLLREIDRSFSAPHRYRFEPRLGDHGRG